MHNQDQRVLNLPAGYFGMVLGTIGMGFAWRYAGTIWPVTRWPGEILVALAVAIRFLLSVAFLTRAVRFPHSVLAEMRHPVMSSFVSLFLPQRYWWPLALCRGADRCRWCCLA